MQCNGDSIVQQLAASSVFDFRARVRIYFWQWPVEHHVARSQAVDK